MAAETHRRVKLYALNAERQWDDRGTGHVSSLYVENQKATSLQVRAESDGSVLLDSKIQPDTAYQKQQVSVLPHAGLSVSTCSLTPLCLAL